MTFFNNGEEPPLLFFCIFFSLGSFCARIADNNAPNALLGNCLLLPACDYCFVCLIRFCKNNAIRARNPKFPNHVNYDILCNCYIEVKQMFELTVWLSENLDMMDPCQTVTILHQRLAKNCIKSS